jgi:hypothetical protein
MDFRQATSFGLSELHIGRIGLSGRTDLFRAGLCSQSLRGVRAMLAAKKHDADDGRVDPRSKRDLSEQE